MSFFSHGAKLMGCKKRGQNWWGQFWRGQYCIHSYNSGLGPNTYLYLNTPNLAYLYLYLVLAKVLYLYLYLVLAKVLYLYLYLISNSIFDCIWPQISNLSLCEVYLKCINKAQLFYQYINIIYQTCNNYMSIQFLF